MKEWKVNYSVDEENEDIRELETTVHAENIVGALAKAIREIEKPLEKKGNRVVIWSIGIMDDNVF